MSQSKSFSYWMRHRQLRTLVSQAFDVAVIGAGPGGYVAAITAGQLGLKTACIERHRALGGTCLNVGCIPSKSLLHNSQLFRLATSGFAERGIAMESVALDLAKMQQHKERAVTGLTKGIELLFKKNKVTRFVGHGRLVSANEIEIKGREDGAQSQDLQHIEAKHIIIATGSEPMGLPGIEVDEQDIVSSTGALSFTRVPEHLVVVGGGIIGLELGTVWNRLGSKVTVVESFNAIGGSAIDAGISEMFLRILKRQGMNFILGTKVKSIHKDKGGIEALLDGQPSLTCDKVLVCVGRRPLTEGLGLEPLGIKTDSKGRILVNERFETNVPSVKAIGDVVPGPMLAHKAEEEGIACARQIAGFKGHVNYSSIPSVIYTHPEVAWVGASAGELEQKCIPHKTGTFPFLANSRAKTIGDVDGAIKVLAHAETDVVLGIHIIGPNASEMIAEATLAMATGCTSQSVGNMCHAHPTFSEALKEACMAVTNKPIHF